MVNLTGEIFSQPRKQDLSSAGKNIKRIEFSPLGLSRLDAFLHNAQLTSPFPSALCAAPRPPDCHIEDKVKYLKEYQQFYKRESGQKDHSQQPYMTHLVVIHPPQLDLPIVSSTDDQRHAWVEVGPVHSPEVKTYLSLTFKKYLAALYTMNNSRKKKQPSDVIYLSWPSNTCFTTASAWPKRSGEPGFIRL